jgi:alpha-1,2-mannosyltransferase
MVSYEMSAANAFSKSRSTERRASAFFPLINPVLLSLGILAVALHAVRLHVWSFHILRYLNYNDFGKFYYSLEQWRNSRTLYSPSPATVLPFGEGRTEHLLNMNPPHFHCLIWPLTYLPVDQAYVVWTVVNIGAGIAALVAMARAVPVRATGAAWVVGLVLACASAPVLAWAGTGQMTGLLFGAVTWIWLLMRRGLWERAGLAIGLVCSVKPFLGLLVVYLLIRRQWRAGSIAALALLGTFAAGLMIFGVEAHRDWLAALRDAHWIGAVMNASLYGIVGRTWSLDVFTISPTAEAIAGALALIAIVMGMLAARRAPDLDTAVLIVLTTSLLASPLGWVYYVPIVAGPVLAMRKAGNLSAWVFVALAGFMIPHLWIFPFPSRLFALTLGSVYTWSLLMLWAQAVRPSLQKRTEDGCVP